MFSINGLIIIFVLGVGIGLIIEHIKQDLKARKDIKDLENIFPTVWKD
tara:strand:+ start:310 stop:453 length:144 start_codon:yes stop_codon:yes gene_type:complete